MRLLESLELFNAQAAALKESVTIQEGTEGLAEDARMKGHRRFRITSNPSARYRKSLGAAAQLLEGYRAGRVRRSMLEEAMSSDDFPILLGDLMYRQLLGNYSVLPSTYTAISQEVQLKDFRTLNLEMIDGGREVPEPIKEYAPYPELSFTESKLQISVGKFGRRFGMSFEMLINDNLNAFSSRPSQLSIGCKMLEQKTVTGVYLEATGPKASYFNAGSGNKLATNAPISPEAIEAMMKLMSRQRDSDGNPINILGYILEYAPANQVTVDKIMNATEFQIGDTTDTSIAVIKTGNWIKGKITPLQNPWFPIVATTAAYGDTSWILWAVAPGSGRSPLYHGFLQGRRTPGLYMRDPDQMNLAGGDSGVFEGSFDNDAIDFKCRHFFGAVAGDVKLGYASNGSGVADS